MLGPGIMIGMVITGTAFKVSNDAQYNDDTTPTTVLSCDIKQVKWNVPVSQLDKVARVAKPGDLIKIIGGKKAVKVPKKPKLNSLSPELIKLRDDLEKSFRALKLQESQHLKADSK